MDSHSDTDEKEQIPSEIFRAVLGTFILQGIILGGKYGIGYGAIFGGCIGFGIGALPGLGYGVLIGVVAGTIMGLIGGCVLGGFSVWWGRSQGGVLSDQHTANRDGYRLGISRLAVVTTVLGCLVLFPLILPIVLSWLWSWLWDYKLLIFLFLDIVPSLIAGFAAYQGAKKIIAWYEGNVGRPRDIMLIGPSQEGIWPPAPIRPIDSTPGIGRRLKE